MAQHDYVIANGTGAAVRSDLNNGLSAIVTQNSGATEPATTYAFMRWADTTAGVMKMRNSANNAWITLYQLDGEWTNIAFENGTAAAPSIYFKDSGTDTGFYSPGANQVGISTGGTARLTIDSNGNVDIDSNTLYVDATNNRVGLGTSNPAGTLHVNGQTYIQGAVSGGNANSTLIGNNAGLAQIWALGADTSTTGSMTFVVARSNLTSSTQAITIDSSARVGIGSNTGFVERLHVNGNIRTDANDTGLFFNSSTTAITGNGTSSYIAFATSNAEKARLDSSGRFLVGTSTARSNLFNTTYSSLFQVEAANSETLGRTSSFIYGNSNTSGPIITFGKHRGTSVGGNTVVQSGDECGRIIFQGSDGTEFVQAAVIAAEVDGTPGANDMPGRLVFSTTADGASSPTERMRIDNSGNVLINRTSQTASEKFAVYTGTSGTNTAYFWYGQTDDRANVICRQDRSIGATVGVQIAFLNQTGSNVGQISSTGSATTYTTSSDYRLKENVVPLTGAVDRLGQLQVHRFNFLADPETTVDGFIAHEVQEIVPEAIVGDKDAINEDGSIKPQGIDQSKLVPLLTAALQETIAELQALKAEVAALKGA